MDALGAQALADGRLRLIRTLGEGGMGVVYEAFDRDTRGPVAVKMMRSAAPDALLRLKTEFRALREVHHENLVRLGELFLTGDACFFTMELVDGVDFLEHVFAATATRRRPRTAATISGSRKAPTGREEDERTVWDADTLRLEVLFDEGRLRAALRQLALGLAALHRAGKVHRDVKPSNVLIDHDGRLVLLDFGLAADVGDTIAAGTIEGTVEYMAPEQATGVPAGPPADLYAVGVLLYEALTGRPPFVGDTLDVLSHKQSLEPIAPSVLFSGVPADLDELALALLRKEPARRPSAQEVVDGLAESRRSWSPGGARVIAAEPPFVGRAEHLAALSTALEDSAKRPVAMLVAGESGIGKSTLIRKFAADLRGSGAVILSGRCHAQESVPFRAFDGVADALTRYLLSLPPEERAAMLPADAACLSRLFRVFERLAPGELDETDALSGVDVRARRRRAFAVLRELLDNLSRRGRVALVIDDLQWIDSDSVQLLEALFSLRPPRLLLVAMMRPAKDRLAEVRAALAPLAIEVRELALAPLSNAESTELAVALLPGREAAEVEKLASVCHGSPLFLEQVAAAAVAGKPCAETLERVLWDKIAELSDDERRVLDLVCVAGLGLDHGTVGRAGGVQRQDYAAAVQRLAEQRLVQTTGSRRNDLIEPYHDQVRQAVRGMMTPESARRRHGELAESLERRSAPSWLIFHHWLTAGDAAKAAPYAIEAAVGAQRELSARRVAHLCQVALGLLPEHHPARRDLCRALAVALGNAGQGAEAAQWYLEAAKQATGVEQIELRRLAADHLLRCGRFDDGMAVVRDVLAAVSVELPASPRAALASLLWRRARLRVPALGRPRADDATRLRTDVCLSVGTSLAMVDTISGASLHALGALEARRLGDPERTARALAIESGYAAIAGTRGAPRTAQLLAAAERAAAIARTPATTGLVLWMRGVAAFLQGRYAEGFEISDAASRNFAATCPGQVWEQASAEVFAAWALSHLGRLDELGRRLDDLEQAARWHDDRYTQTLVRVGNGVLPALAADDPRRATIQVDLAIGQWSQGGFHLQHLMELVSRSEIALYTGDAPAAWKRYTAAWPSVESSMLLRIQHSRLTQNDLRARVALATGDLSLLPLVRDYARTILKEGPTWASGLAHVRLAALSAADGRGAEARAGLDRGALLLDGAGLSLHAAAARLRLAWLDGADLESTEPWKQIVERGVRKPDRWLEMYAPWVA